ncbi:hypothetical protein BH23PLA1_BH23PLA1_06760 [soil metagenome]
MSRTTRARLPVGLLGMIALVASAESCLARRPIESATKMSLAWRRSGEAARTDAIGADILCFGDSLMKLGVQPHVLEAGLQQSAYNLAVPGGQGPSTYFLLRTSLEAGACPKAIVVNFHENLLAIAPRFSGHALPELLNIRDWIDLALHARDPDLSASTAIGLLLPSYRGRTGWREAVVSALRGEPREMLGDLIALDRNWQVNAGAQVASPLANHPFKSEFDEVAGPTPERARWAPHPVNAAYVRRFLELTQLRGIKVYWVLPPTSPEWTARRAKIGTNEAIDQYLLKTLQEYPDVTVVDGRATGFVAEVFRDETHLDGRGATVLSQGLASLITEQHDAIKKPWHWICLPRYEEVGIDITLEDVNRSKAVIASRLGRVRR